MSAGLLVWCVVLVFLGLNVALIAWLMLRLAVGAWWAQLGFWVVAMATVHGITQLIA